MSELQNQIIEELGVQPSIDPAAEVERRVKFLADYALSTSAKGFVLGISGGIDSTLAGRLSQLAAERLRAGGHEATFYAVRLPYKVQSDEADAQAALAFIQPDESLVYNVAAGVDGLLGEFERATGDELSDFAKGNLKARARMIAQYAIAGEKRALVVGTDHAAESVTGFFTKFGDGGADILPLFTLDKRQNRALLRYLGASEAIYSKAPTADLLDLTPGREDEDELGLTYEQIDDYLEGDTIDGDAATALEEKYLKTRHKRTVPVTIADTWWRP